MMGSIWDFQTLVMRRLLQWSMVSAALGGVLTVFGRRFQRGMGAQFVGWAAVNFAIAYFGFTGTQRRRRGLGARAETPEQQASETRNLRRLLLVNAGLDVLYIIGGWLYGHRGGRRAFRRGTSMGIVLQGAFLFAFDLYHAQRLSEGN